MHSKLEYHDIAQIQLDEAIRLFEQENYICSTTLAGAAAEILSKLVVDYSGAESYRQKAINNIKREYPDFDANIINDGRNALKHPNKPYFDRAFNMKHYAGAYILMGIGDYFTLIEKLTTPMNMFWKNHSNEFLNIESEAI